MQITMRPGGFEDAAMKLVNPSYFAGGRDKCAGAHLLTTQQMPQTVARYLWNAHGMAWSDSHLRPIGIQQAGAMDFPVHPFVGSHKHTDSAARECQKSVPEPDDAAAANSAPLQKHWNAIVNTLLNVIHANTIHQPCNGLLGKFQHLTPPEIPVIRCRLSQVVHCACRERGSMLRNHSLNSRGTRSWRLRRHVCHSCPVPEEE